MNARELGGVFGRERQAVLKAMDRLMLGTVIAVEARHVGKKADAADIGNEHHDAQKRLAQVPGNCVVAGERSHKKVGDAYGQRNEQSHAKCQAKGDGEDELPSGGV